VLVLKAYRRIWDSIILSTDNILSDTDTKQILPTKSVSNVLNP